MEGDVESQGGVSQPAPEQEASQQQIVEGATPRSRMSHVTQLPLTRVKNVIKSDPDITLASQEAVILIAKATELFIGYLARKSHVFTVQGKRKTIQRRDIDACIPVHDELNFLEGTLDS